MKSEHKRHFWWKGDKHLTYTVWVCWIWIYCLASLDFSFKHHKMWNKSAMEQVAQLWLTNPCHALHYGKRQNFQAVTWPWPFRGWYVVLLVTSDIAYLCKKFDDSSFSYSWGMLRALKASRLRLAMINRRTKFELPTITCHEDMKGSAKICKNSCFEPPFGGLR